MQVLHKPHVLDSLQVNEIDTVPCGMAIGRMG